jgi:hypothetical protein
LAAAYAEAGRFDEALQEQGRAIDMLRAEDAPEGSIERATARRRDYRDREPQRRL